MNCADCNKPLDRRTSVGRCRACNGRVTMRLPDFPTGPGRPPSVTWTREMDAALRTLKREGATVRETARRVGVCTKLITRRCRELELPQTRGNSRRAA